VCVGAVGFASAHRCSRWPRRISCPYCCAQLPGNLSKRRCLCFFFFLLTRRIHTQQGPGDTIGKMMVNVLLQRYTGPKRQLVDMQSVAGDTAMHIAVRAGNEAVLRAIDQAQAEPRSAEQCAGETARSLATTQPPIIGSCSSAAATHPPAAALLAAAAAAAAVRLRPPLPAVAQRRRCRRCGRPRRRAVRRQRTASRRAWRRLVRAAAGRLAGDGGSRPSDARSGPGSRPGERAIAARRRRRQAYDKDEFSNVQSRQLDMPTAESDESRAVGRRRSARVRGRRRAGVAAGAAGAHQAPVRDRGLRGGV
jgi:hypothetical protein